MTQLLQTYMQRRSSWAILFWRLIASNMLGLEVRFPLECKVSPLLANKTMCRDLKGGKKKPEMGVRPQSWFRNSSCIFIRVTAGRMVCVYSHKPVGFSYSIPDGRRESTFKNVSWVLTHSSACCLSTSKIHFPDLMRSKWQWWKVPVNFWRAREEVCSRATPYQELAKAPCLWYLVWAVKRGTDLAFIKGSGFY